MDAGTPRVLRIAGDTRSVRELAAILTEVTGEQYRTLRVGGIGLLDEDDPFYESSRATARLGVPAMAGHAVPAGHVHRRRQAHSAR